MEDYSGKTIEFTGFNRLMKAVDEIQQKQMSTLIQKLIKDEMKDPKFLEILEKQVEESVKKVHLSFQSIKNGDDEPEYSFKKKTNGKFAR